MADLSLIVRSLTYTKQAELVTMNNWSAYSINLSKKINTPNSLSFNIPANAPHYSKIIVGASLIEFENEIYIVRSNKITKDDNSIAEVSCEHLSSNLAYIKGGFYEYQAEKVSTLVNEVLKDTNWKLGETDIADSNLRHLISSDETVLANLLMIAENFGAVCTFTSNAEGVNKVNFYVNKKERGFYITNTKNMQGFTLSYDTTDCCNRIWAFGSINKSTGIQTNILSLTDSKGYVEDFSFYTNQGYSLDYIQKHPELFLMETEMTLDDISDEQTLYDLAVKELDKRKNPKTVLSVDVLDLSQIPKYFMEKPDVYETAILIDETLNLKLEATITGFSKNYDDDLGMSLDISDTIEYSSFMKDIIDKVDGADTSIKDIELGWKDVIDSAKNEATNIINGGLKDSHVIVRKDEILIMNTTTPETATEIWRWNRGGLAFGDSYHGQFSIAITNDGKINADFISTGSLQAEIIKTGILSSLNNKTWINMDNGTFNFGDGKITYDGSNLDVNVDSLKIKSKNVATTQDIDSFKVEVGQSGGENITSNGAFKTDISSWGIHNYNNAATNCKVEVWHDDNEWILQGKNCATIMASGNFDDRGEYGISQSLTGLKTNTDYTVSFLVAGHRCQVSMLVRNTGTWEWLAYHTGEIGIGGKDTRNWSRITKTFNTKEYNSARLEFLISYPGQDATLWVTDVMINEGIIPQPWQPSSKDLEGYTNAKFEILNDRVTSEIGATNGKLTEYKQDIDGFKFLVERSGGSNLIKNSLGKANNSFWQEFYYSGSVAGIQVNNRNDSWTNYCDALQIRLLANASNLDCGVIQKIKVDKGKDYTFKCLIAGHRSGKKIGFTNEGNGAWVSDVWTAGDIHGADSSWHEVVLSFTATENYVNLRLGFTEGWENDAYLWIRDMMLAEGKITQMWQPHSSEVYAGITSINQDGVKVSMSNGEGLQGYSRTAYDGFSIYDANGNRKAWFGDGNSAYIQSLSTDNIYNRHLIKWAEYRPTNIYINPISTGDGTGRDINNKSNSINHALEWLRSQYGCYSYKKDIIIYIDQGTYYEDIYIGGWIGTGQILLYFDNGATWYGNHQVEESTMPVYIDGRRWNDGAWINEGCLFIKRGDREATWNIRSSFCYIKNTRALKEGWSGVTGVWNGYGNTFMQSTCGSRVHLFNNDVVGFYSFVKGNDSSFISVYNNRGHCHDFANMYWGSLLQGQGNIPLYNNGVLMHQASHWVDKTVTTHNSLYQPKDNPPQPPAPTWAWFESSFNLSNLRTAPEGSGSSTSSRNGEWGQGSWGGYQSHRGYADLGDNPANWSSGGRSFTVELTLTRSNTSHGNAGATPVPKIKLPNGSFWSCGVGFARGQTSTVTLPGELANAIANGSVKTLEMWAGNSNSDYSFYNYSAIKIRCEKQI